MNVRVIRSTQQPDRPPHPQFGHRLSDVLVELGLGTVAELEAEVYGMWDVLLGRVDSPVEGGYLSLQEVATAYHSRALEIEALIRQGERKKVFAKTSEHYLFRVGELAPFIEVAKKAAQLGSRRLAQEQLLHEQRYED